MSWLQRLFNRPTKPSQWFPGDFLRPNDHDQKQTHTHWITSGLWPH